MPKWRLRAFDGATDTGLDEVVSGSEREISKILERLIAHHLSPQEIIAASPLDARFKINMDKRRGQPTQMSTTGTDHHYIAIELREYSRSS
jgi:hypothetical protein